MNAEQSSGIVAFIGIFVQLGGSLLLVVLFALLGRFVLRRAYFTAWTAAWAAIMVAIASLFVRFTAFAGEGATALPEGHPGIVAFYVLYQSAKLVALGFLFAGTRSYVAGQRARLAGWGLWVAAVGYAVATALFVPGTLNGMVFMQSLVAVPMYAWCARRLLSLPPSRRSLGSMATGTGFALIAAVWTWYAVAFGDVVWNWGVPPVGVAMAVNYNSYYDFLLNVLLGYGMIVLLMEDAKREVDDARAELHIAHDRMRRAAFFDSLTDTLNRRAFSEGVGLEMARATFGTVVIADVDDLKVVNDRWGHAAGDRLLRHCAATLRTTLRSYDKLYRWGGDEFLIIIPTAHAGDVRRRLETAIAAASPLDLSPGAPPVRLEVSFGAADYASGEQIAQAIESADRGMYEHKAGRKRASPVPPVALPPGVSVIA